MSTHVFHPDVHEEGLQDGCERCEEQANDPLGTLDSEMLADLHHRIAAGLAARSFAEQAAMDRIVRQR